MTAGDWLKRFGKSRAAKDKALLAELEAAIAAGERAKPIRFEADIDARRLAKAFGRPYAKPNGGWPDEGD
jgi:hypothetical protein